MLAKPLRLTDRRTFDQLYRQGTRSGSAHLLIRFRKNPQGYLRIGIVVSTKISKRAVRRNRYKRHIRAELQAILSHLPKGWDILITVRSPIDKDPREDWKMLREEVRSLLENQFLS